MKKHLTHFHHRASDIAMRRFRGTVTACLSLTIVLAFGTAARAGPFDVETKLTATDGAVDDQFGSSVGIKWQHGDRRNNSPQ